jgi:N-formylglutamate amidohydrolase
MRRTTRRAFLGEVGRVGSAALAVRSGVLTTPQWMVAAAQISQSPLVLAQRGTLPLLILASHGGDEPVPGVPVRTQGVNTQDARTKDLAQALAARLASDLGETPYMVIADFHRRYIDANRSPANAFEHPSAETHYLIYHQSIRAFVESIRGEFPEGALLLDLHGQGAEPATIHRGTQNGRTVQSMLHRHGEASMVGEQSFLGQLQAAGYTVYPPNTPLGQPREAPAWNGGYTVQTYGSHHPDGIDAIQLEFGADLRRQAYLETMAQDLAQALAVFLAQFVFSQRKSGRVSR